MTDRQFNDGEGFPKHSEMPKNQVTINWKIINQVIPYKPGQKCCNLCLPEKLEILLANQPATFNKRSELTGKCRYKNKFKLNKLPT